MRSLCLLIFCSLTFQIFSQSRYVYGTNLIASTDSGLLYDNGSDTGNYFSTGTGSSFTTTICGSVEIELRFTQIKLASGNGIIRIFDGKDSFSPAISPPGGITSNNQSEWQNKIITARSGAFFFTFQAGSGASDSGFCLYWKALTDTTKLPGTFYQIPCDSIYEGNSVFFFGNVRTRAKDISWEYFFPGNPGMGFNKNLDYVFTTTGTHTICLTAATCLGRDTFCKAYEVKQVFDTVDLEFVAEDYAPEVNQSVRMVALSCKASSYSWSIYPTTFTILTGTMNSRNPVIRFNQDTCYTITVQAWNSFGGKSKTLKTITKSNIVCAKSYVTPFVSIKNNKYRPDSIHFYSYLPDETAFYTRDTLLYYVNINKKPYFDFYCYKSNKIKIIPNQLLDSFKFSLWVDYNRNGLFTDPGEQLISTGAMAYWTPEFYLNLPAFKNINFEVGPSRFRIAFSDINSVITSDTIFGSGTFTDINFNIRKKYNSPVFSSSFGDTIIRQADTSNSGCSAIITSQITALDSFEGDLTSNIIFSTNLDCKIPGIYYLNAKVCNCSGICKETSYTIFIWKDTIPPVINLNTSDTICHEINTPYTPVQITVTDQIDSTKYITVTKSGSVSSNVKGWYTETYTATDRSGNSSQKTRHIMVDSCNKSSVNSLGNNVINIFPVPANSTIELSYPFIPDLDYQLSIHDFTGKLILSEKIGALHHIIDCSKIPNGSYIVRLSDGLHEYQSKLIIFHE